MGKKMPTVVERWSTAETAVQDWVKDKNEEQLATVKATSLDSVSSSRLLEDVAATTEYSAYNAAQSLTAAIDATKACVIEMAENGNNDTTQISGLLDLIEVGAKARRTFELSPYTTSVQASVDEATKLAIHISSTTDIPTK
jgi:hypothetical protein